MTINSRSLGGGDFVADSAALGGYIASGSGAGIIKTIVPPAGKRILLTALQPGGGAAISNISLTFGVRLIIDDESLLALPNQKLTPGSFVIGVANYDGQTSATAFQSAGFIPHLLGRVGESLVINAGTVTGFDIYYNYQIGE